MKGPWLLCLIFLATTFLIGCVAGPNSVVHTAASGGSVAGFWLGVWHGVIMPFTFIISLFSNDVSFYEVHNSGGWYDFGFVLGTSIIYGGIGKTSSRRS